MSKNSNTIPSAKQVPHDTHPEIELDEITNRRVESFASLFSERTWKLFLSSIRGRFLPAPQPVIVEKPTTKPVSEEEKIRRKNRYETLWAAALETDPGLREWFYSTILSKTGNVHDSDELLQQADVAALESVDTLNKPGSFKHWFDSIVAHKIADYHRKKRKEIMSAYDYAFLDNVPDASTLRETRPEDTREKRIHIAFEILRTIPQHEREVYILYRAIGLSQSEIAEQLEIHPNTVRNRLKKAEEMLSERSHQLVVFGLTSCMAPERLQLLMQQAVASYMASPAATTGGVWGMTGGVSSYLFGVLGKIVLPFVWLAFFLIGGRLFGKASVEKAPTLRARLWIVKHSALCYCGIVLFPALFALVGLGSVHGWVGVQHEHTVFSVLNWVVFGSVLIYALWLRERYRQIVRRADGTPEESVREYAALRKTCNIAFLAALIALTGLFCWLLWDVLLPQIVCFS